MVCKLYLNFFKQKETIGKLWGDRWMAHDPNPPELQTNKILVIYVSAPSSVIGIVPH